MNQIRKTGCKATALVLLTAVSAFAFASMGGGGGKKKSGSLLLKDTRFEPFHSNISPFSLKSTYSYRGSQVLSREQSGKFMMQNSVVTYRNGNTVHILPYQQKKILSKFKTPTPAPQR